MRGDAAITVLKALHGKLKDAHSFNATIIDILERSLKELQSIDNSIGLENSDAIKNIADQLRLANPDLAEKTDLEILTLYGIKVE